MSAGTAYQVLTRASSTSSLQTKRLGAGLPLQHEQKRIPLFHEIQKGLHNRKQGLSRPIPKVARMVQLPGAQST
eukprot:CAMPEP_0184379046 /NCGR_PEP_ID=MMETSP0007-20130409/3525_1 /TAXON_ID=97485 /ORGANISM="Prymnesium parvum, Strain Texoma1" /LENGTH=73 /DNA_ID=CAMNT_0026723535 /DNA_START=157 /DNA_END=378 /DNA_ORIENTATION=+